MTGDASSESMYLLENVMHVKNETSRITIDIPKESHKRLKAMAAVLGKSMREIVVESIEKNLSDRTIFNKKTLRAIKDAENKKGLVHAEDIEDLFKKLGI